MQHSPALPSVHKRQKQRVGRAPRLRALLAMLHSLYCRDPNSHGTRAGPWKKREGLPRNSRRLCQPGTGSWPHASPVSRVAIVPLLAKTSAVLGPKTTLPEGPVEEALDASGLMYSTGRYTGLPENHIHLDSPLE